MTTIEEAPPKPLVLRDQNGEIITIANLPDPKTIGRTNVDRWSFNKKTRVVLAVNGGLLSAAEACERYGLSAEEFAAWQDSYSRGGPLGLRSSVKLPRS